MADAIKSNSNPVNDSYVTRESVPSPLIRLNNFHYIGSSSPLSPSSRWRFPEGPTADFLLSPDSLPVKSHQLSGLLVNGLG